MNPLKKIRSHLSWRLLLLFFAAAIVPVLALGIASYVQISNELTKQSHLQSRLLAKSTGMDIYEKLRYLSNEFKLLTQTHEQADAQQLTEYLQDSNLKSLFRVDQQLQLQLLAGQLRQPANKLLQQSFDATSDGKTAVLYGNQPGDSLYMFRRLDAAHVIGSEISTAELWSTEYLDTMREDVCIVTPQSQPLHCNFNPDADWLATLQASLAENDSGFFEWRNNDKSYLSTYWSIFFAPHFNFPKWTVVISVPSELALSPVNSFQNIFPRILLLTVILVILLTSISIRRHLQPLNKLVDATKNIAAGDFNQRLQLESNDEFSKLGEAFNSMAARLGNQFTHLHILAKLDSNFQQTNSLEGIVQAVWAALSQLPEIEPLGLCCIDSNEHNCLNWKFLMVDGRLQTSMNAEAAFNEHFFPDKPVTGKLGDLRQQYPMLNSLEFGADENMLLLPAMRDTTLIALLLLRIPEPDKLSEESRQLIQQVLDLSAIRLEAFFLGQNLHYLAHHDVLTGLPNRSMISEAIETSINSARANDLSGAVILIDLDKFKAVNDSQGHAAGDELLVQVARRFKKIMRPKDTISRLSGDEFVAVLVDLDPDKCLEIATRTAARLAQALDEPFKIGETRHNISASMGIAVFPQDGKTPAEILQAADAAMYSVKGKGRGHYGYYSAELHHAMLDQLEVERSLIPAVNNGEFMLCYQPVIDQSSNKVISAEALIRWIHPERGVLPPGLFIEIAEKSTLIEDLGEWVLRRACADFQNWLKNGIELSYLSVNISTRQLRNDNFVQTIEKILQETGMQAAHLVLEITETTLIECYKTGRKIIDELSRMGVKISIDDFGTGYASLGYLKSLPTDFIKIDRTFMRDLPTNRYDSAIVNALSTLAHTLDISLIAEGVETQEQAEYLKQQGINNIQGYFYSKPLDVEQFVEYIKSSSQPAETQTTSSGDAS
ncbi:MAG: EAL domain-containing protein [Chromatiales bacterium]|jgi:diguanylate cyclase (GGDEF)-like protein